MDADAKLPRRKPNPKFEQESEDTPIGKKKEKGEAKETTLHLLASRFIDFMEHQPENQADIRAICEALDIPKRRVYDVTNVLEGVGMVRKVGRNGYKWLGRPKPEVKADDVDDEAKLDSLRAEKADLDDESRILDKAIAEASLQISGLMKDADIAPFAFVYLEELRALTASHPALHFAVECPYDTQVTCTYRDSATAERICYETSFRADAGNINVFPLSGLAGVAIAPVPTTGSAVQEDVFEDADYEETRHGSGAGDRRSMGRTTPEDDENDLWGDIMDAEVPDSATRGLSMFPGADSDDGAEYPYSNQGYNYIEEPPDATEQQPATISTGRGGRRGGRARSTTANARQTHPANRNEAAATVSKTSSSSKAATTSKRQRRPSARFGDYVDPDSSV